MALRNLFAKCSVASGAFNFRELTLPLDKRNVIFDHLATACRIVDNSLLDLIKKELNLCYSLSSNKPLFRRTPPSSKELTHPRESQFRLMT